MKGKSKHIKETKGFLKISYNWLIIANKLLNTYTKRIKKICAKNKIRDDYIFVTINTSFEVNQQKITGTPIKCARDIITFGLFLTFRPFISINNLTEETLYGIDKNASPHLQYTFHFF